MSNANDRIRVILDQEFFSRFDPIRVVEALVFFGLNDGEIYALCQLPPYVKAKIYLGLIKDTENNIKVRESILKSLRDDRIEERYWECLFKVISKQPKDPVYNAGVIGAIKGCNNLSRLQLLNNDYLSGILNEEIVAAMEVQFIYINEPRESIDTSQIPENSPLAKVLAKIGT